jgi:DUF1680 family protein
MKWMQLLEMAALAAWCVGTSATPVELKMTPRAEPFALEDVRLLDGPFRDAMLRDKAYLLSLDADRLLHNFRVNAGLPSAAKPYGGWEAPGCELRGHSVGHYLSACSLMFASTGDPALKQRVDYLVAELAKCQAAAPQKGFHAGYLSAFPESFIDRVVARQPVWAPWYTLHKIMAGLLEAHQHCGNAQALDVLVQMAGWVKLRVDPLTPEQMQAMLDTEFGGMNEVLANLYAVTGNPDHLRLAQAFDHRRMFEPLARREDRLNGFHANTQIPKMIGAAREYELTGEPRYREIAETFWDRVALHRSYVIGGHSDGEFFFPIADFARHLTTDTCETCNTYNMLKLTRHLFAWNPDARTMDFYERGLYNHILASQDPEKGMFVYLMSLKPGHFKTYSTPEDSFWCCVGTGMENHAKYGDTIWFHDADSLYLNLFIASELTWREHGLTVRLETKFPQEDTMRVTVKCVRPLTGGLNIRYPGWSAAPMTVTVNGEPQEIDQVPGSYVSLRREWHDGDRVEVRIPMALHTESLPGEDNTVAMLYGPIVLAGELGTADMPSPYARGQTDLNHVPTPPVPVFLCDAREFVEHTEPVPGKPLAFETKGTGRPQDVTLIPFYQTHHQRYSVYWQLCSADELKARAAEQAAAAARQRELEARTVDEVRIGAHQSETDHQFQGENTQSGELLGRRWRHAPGGWFSYEVKVPHDQPASLMVTYWGSDAGNRTFDVLVDGEKVATQTLERNHPDAFFDQAYAIPEKLTQGRDHVTVKFQAQPGNTAGGVFGLRVLKPAKTD